jgi:hypothetical protein
VTREEAIKYLSEEQEKTKEVVALTERDFKVSESVWHTEYEAFALAIAALREQPRWISVEERLPDNEDVVLCVTKNKRPFVCRYDHYWKHWRVSGSVKVTHWMPLPEPPTEEEV